MGRPYIKLDSQNIVHELRNALDNSLYRFTDLPGVVGVLLDGGLSRGYGDHLSEIDLVIYLTEPYYREYHDGKCPFALGISVIDGNLYDIKLADFEEEVRKDYDPIALWDLSYASVLYDPDHKIAGFIQQKLAPSVDISTAGALLWSAYWQYKLAGDIWIYRQDTLQGHYVFNGAIKPLISALFIANKEYIPHDKWLVHMSRSLTWKPDHWDALLMGAMETGDYSVQSLVNRQQNIEQIWNSINHKLCEMSDFYRKLDFTQKAGYESLCKLVAKDEYTVDEWQSVQGLDSLNYEPVHSIFRRIGDKIVLNKTRLLSLKPEDMYIWMYQIADEVRKEV